MNPQNQKRAPSLLAAALLVACAMAASEGAAETPRPNVTFAGVPRSVEKELLKLNATGKKFQCLDEAKTQIPMDKVSTCAECISRPCVVMGRFGRRCWLSRTDS